MIVQAASSRAEQLLAAQRVLVIAHRGNSRVAPENTLPAFRSAAALGVDMVELDYHHSADGVPVVIHDPTLDRTTDAAARWGEAKLAVADRTMAELATLDGGSWFSTEFARTRLPSLVDAVEAIHAAGRVTLIERKTGDAATLIAALATHDRLGDAIVQAFDWPFLAECRRLEPRLVVGALGRHEITAAKLAAVVALGAKFIGWADADLNAPNIALAHQFGLKVFDFTVDEETRATELIALGLDGIISNVPARMQQFGQIRP
ncbi:MAG: glycerophosphodiester phosphodiesterase family protein [Pirellulales bacterium]